MIEILTDFFLLFVLWYIGWAGVFLFTNKLDYLERPLSVTIYFLSLSLIALYLFSDVIGVLYEKITFFSLLILFCFLFFNFLTYFLSNKFLKRPYKLIEQYPKVLVIKMDYRYLVSKSFDILYQQIIIIILILLLAKSGLGILQITIVFSILFGIGHVPIIKFENDFFGFLTLIASFTASFLFPILILNFQYGFIYTYILHWLFYTNVGLLSWLMNPKILHIKT